MVNVKIRRTILTESSRQNQETVKWKTLSVQNMGKGVAAEIYLSQSRTLQHLTKNLNK